MKTIRESQFCNTYGALTLVEADDGRLFIQMQDCLGDDYFGPLSEEDVAAFHRLCDLPSADG